MFANDETMKKYSEKVQVTLDYSDLLNIVDALITHIEELIEIKGPSILILNSIARAERLNELLKKADFDHWDSEKFEQLRSQANRNEERKRN